MSSLRVLAAPRRRAGGDLEARDIEAGDDEAEEERTQGMAAPPPDEVIGRIKDDHELLVESLEHLYLKPAELWKGAARG